MPILPLLLFALSPIQIDGSFDDWTGTADSFEDSSYIYERIKLPRPACLQKLAKEKAVSIGPYEILFSPNESGHGVSCSKDGEQISPYAIGLVFAPSTASREFEIRIDKPQTKKNCTFDLEKTGAFRVVSWNVQFGSLLDNTRCSTRILKALKPDVLLLQELDSDDTPEIVVAFLQDTLGDSWNVLMSEVNGTERHHKLRSAIASTFPLEELVIKNKGTLKAVRAHADIYGTVVQLLSLHLRCCGGPQGEEEEQRQREAKIIRRAAKSPKSKASIIAGDWNLVGTKKPLKIVVGRDFTVVEALQPDGELYATWSNTNSPFTPGRLDWMVFNGKKIQTSNSFVLDSSDLDAETLEKYGLQRDDTANLSDHLPLVADFVFTK
ncbi:MAG: endonuclease/exonuclease/phosphatase family protein [Planctomycetes bacterium]|nr:endonuclease/exonuclease/phosphatase family protein [Planctomycetota bacterium]